MLAHLGLLGPYEVSPDHPDGVGRACQPEPPPAAPTHPAVPPSQAGSSASLLRARPPPQETFQRFTSRSGRRLRLRPLQTPGHPDALGISYSNFNGRSSARTLTSSSSALPGRTRESARSRSPGHSSNSDRDQIDQVDPVVFDVSSSQTHWPPTSSQPAGPVPRAYSKFWYRPPEKPPLSQKSRHAAASA